MATVLGHTIVYLSDSERRSFASAEDDEAMYHGSLVLDKGPFPKSEAEDERFSRRFVESIERGLKALHDGSSQFCADLKPRPGAAIEVLDYFDVFTGESVMMWRIACVPR